MSSVEHQLQTPAHPYKLLAARVGAGDRSEDAENMPYHARDYARPFTYGNLPPGFKPSSLNHVAFEEVLEEPRPARAQAMASASPSMLRKSTRPSISPSRPVLRKTPTRQEFEEMLMERRMQAMREQQTTATQQAQNAAIQKDLDELQQILNETISIKSQVPTAASTSAASNQSLEELAGLKYVETVDLPSVTDVGRSSPMDSGSEPESSATERTQSTMPADPIRPETPAFPAVPKRPLEDRCVSPYPMVTPGTPTLQRIRSGSTPLSSDGADHSRSPAAGSWSAGGTNGSSSGTCAFHDVAPHLVKFAKDSSQFWYKPHITREEANTLLRNAEPGTFIIRNSTTYKNAFGLVIRVDRPPQGLPTTNSSSGGGGSGGDELVRHFLLEPTTRGVRLKGCANEPAFASLSALVYQHSINQLALPCRLTIPDRDLVYASGDVELVAAQKQLLLQGAACNVLYLFSCGMESLTGDEAVRRAVHEMYSRRPLPTPTEVHFKVSQQGITLTDNTRRVFFRRHYTPANISHCAIDPEHRFWSVEANDEGLSRMVNKTIFAFVARPTAGAADNQCHVFCDLAVSQPAAAIVSFANKVLPMDKQNHKML